MKRNYFSPETNELELKIDAVMTNTSEPETGNAGVGEGDGSEGPDLSGGKRGNWGNVWK